jgi:hypothetical protein
MMSPGHHVSGMVHRVIFQWQWNRGESTHSMPGKSADRCCRLLWLFLLCFSVPGCSSRDSFRGEGKTVVVSDHLRSFEGFIHITPDSVAELFERYDQQEFHEKFSRELAYCIYVIDSLNTLLSADHQVDTLSIEFDVEQFGIAGRNGRTIYLSSGFFFVYNNPAILRSILFHEYGHIFYDQLSSGNQDSIRETWGFLERAALLYVFIDGDYSGNAWFGGHPEEGPEELYASAFNLFHNHPDEIRATLKYVSHEYYSLIDRLKRDVGITNLVLFE